MAIKIRLILCMFNELMHFLCYLKKRSLIKKIKFILKFYLQIQLIINKKIKADVKYKYMKLKNKSITFSFFN